MFRPLDKLAPRRALPQHPRKIGLAERVAEKGLGVARLVTQQSHCATVPLESTEMNWLEQFSFQIQGSRAGAPVK
jgi:hypothetical protein